MGKPSIFSRDYEKEVKRRKKRFFTFMFFFLVIIISVGFFSSGTVKAWIKAQLRYEADLNNKNQKNDQQANTSPDSKKGNVAAGKEIKEDTPDTNEEAGYAVQLSQGTVRAVYETKDGEKAFKYISPVDSNVYYNISPTGKEIVILDSKTQQMFYLDKDGKQTDITKVSYQSSKGDIYNKDSVLQQNTNYTWCASPKFIDDDNIAYISNLPWFTNDQKKYVWIVNLKGNAHRSLDSISGNEIKFDALTDKGLTVSLDGKNIFLDASGNVAQ